MISEIFASTPSTDNFPRTCDEPNIQFTYFSHHCQESDAGTSICFSILCLSAPHFFSPARNEYGSSDI